MDTAHPQKFPFILDRNLAKDNCTGNHVCTSCDKVVLGSNINVSSERSELDMILFYYLISFSNEILLEIGLK